MADLNENILFGSFTPITFLNWLELQAVVSTDIQTNLDNYRNYILEWDSRKNTALSRSNDFFNSLYINLFKELTVNFTTEEERRYVVNFDFTKTKNLDSIIPFFIDKLKSICLYYNTKRDGLREKVAMMPYKGTDFSIKKTIRTIILDDVESGNILKIGEGRVSFPPLSSINKNLNVKVESLYDGTNYFDIPLNTANIAITSFGATDIDYNLYIDFKQAIVQAIKEYPLFIDTIFSGFAINYTLSGSELDLLRPRDFINYVQTLSSEDLKLNLKKRLAPEYVSTDFYYLSVGSTISNVVSGLLFKTDNTTGSNLHSLKNIDNPTIASVQSLENLYTDYMMGKFFIPSKSGILQYNAFKKNYYVNYGKLSPNSVYVFPDPDIVESGKFNSPLVYRVDTSFNKQKLQSGIRLGEIISDSYFQRFYPYESLSQDLRLQPYGLSLVTDNVDFWNGEKDSEWTKSDIWPGLDQVEKLPIDERLASLMQDAGGMAEWYSDIYGNEFGLYKDTNSVSIFEKKKLTKGSLYVKNGVTGIVSNANDILNDVYLKYPGFVNSELKDGIYSVYVIKNVVVLETKNYVVVDSYDFDFSSGKFLNVLSPGIYIPKAEINPNIEKFVNSFYVESSDNLYLCFLKLLPSLSSSNYKSIYPAIYQLEVESLRFDQRHPGNGINATVYSLSSNDFTDYPEIDVRYVEGGKFSHKEKFNVFNLTYCAYNLNNVPFFINEQFSISEGFGDFVSYGSIMSKPYFYVRDINFSNPVPDHNLRFTGNYSEPAGYNDLSKFNWDLESPNYNNFHYVTKINPVFLNIPGDHYVHFNFDEYIFGNLFVGCENVKVTKIDELNFIEYKTINGAYSVLSISQDNTWYRVRDYNFNNATFTLSAYRPDKGRGSIILFSINTQLSGFSGIFCDDLYSVYKRVSIDKRGSGVGVVTTTPFCINCGDLCDILYPESGTLTLVPSAGPKSVFSGWLGGGCDGIAGNCFTTITQNQTITAIFNKIPEYTVQVKTNLPNTSVITLDGKITCGASCSAIYTEGELAAVSASPAPVGFELNGFLGSDCGGNNPCGIIVARNYSLTANYVSSIETIDIYKNFNGLTTGAIRGKNDVGSFDVLTSDGSILAYNEGEYDNGYIICSLSADKPIYGFAKFGTPRSEFVSITAVPAPPLVFTRFEGNPCNTTFNECGFFATQAVSITGYFSIPTYTVSVYNSGYGLFYVKSGDGGLDCGTLSLFNFRDKCMHSYLSGTVLSISAFGQSDSKILALSSRFGGGVREGLPGLSALTFEYTVTNNDTITAEGVGDTFYTLTVIKSGSNVAKNSIVQIDVPGFESYTVPAGTTSQIFTFVKGVDVVVYPTRFPNAHEFMYIVGSSPLLYSYEGSNFVNVVTDDMVSQSTQFNQAPTFAVNVNPGQAPLIADAYFATTGRREAFCTMTSNITAVVMFRPIA